MRYANRAKDKLNHMYEISYLDVDGTHYEYVKAKSKEIAERYGNKQAHTNNIVMIQTKRYRNFEALPHNKSFTVLSWMD